MIHRLGTTGPFQLLPGSSAQRDEDCGLSGAVGLIAPVTLSVTMAGGTSGPLPSLKDGRCPPWNCCADRNPGARPERRCILSNRPDGNCLTDIDWLVFAPQAARNLETSQCFVFGNTQVTYSPEYLIFSRFALLSQLHISGLCFPSGHTQWRSYVFAWRAGGFAHRCDSEAVS
jgi:hypothetical protein